MVLSVVGPLALVGCGHEEHARALAQEACAEANRILEPGGTYGDWIPRYSAARDKAAAAEDLDSRWRGLEQTLTAVVGSLDDRRLRKVAAEDPSKWPTYPDPQALVVSQAYAELRWNLTAYDNQCKDIVAADRGGGALTPAAAAQVTVA